MINKITILTISIFTYLIIFNCASTKNYEVTNLISVNNLDTCNGNYNDAIELIQNKSIEEITLNEIAQLRCLKYQTEPGIMKLLKTIKAIADSNFEK